jgi:predicted ribosome quality control (RQC) complex YloA/Tae2 family protein
VGLEAYSAGKEGVHAQLEEALSRMRRKLAALNRELAGDEAIELLRKKGELLFAYASTMSPGLSQFEAQYDPDGPLLSIDLDPTLSAAENARGYFARYEKAKRAYEDVPKLQRAARREVDYLEQLATDLDLAESWPEIDAVRDALQEGGYWRGEKTRVPRGGKPGFRRFTTEGGFVILVGRNALQNQQLLAEKSSPPDLWLHARGIPGSHVILRNDGRPIPETAIEYAAALAAYYSSGRGDTTVEIDVTERRYVRPIKGGKPGMVTYKNERTLTIRPQKHGQDSKS